MVIRHGFVSNSSSSSFVIKRDDLTSLQVVLIVHHSQISEWLGLEDTDCAWDVREDGICVKGSTLMDNFDMDNFLYLIGVDMEKVDWGHS